MKRTFVAAMLAVCLPVGALAQDAAPSSDSEWMRWVPDASSVAMPVLQFEETENTVKNYHKYYYFARADTSFQEALNDLRYCDGMARGLIVAGSSPDMTSAMVQYGVLAGAAGGLIAGVMMDAIVGSGVERAKRRTNMRRCMFYKEYQRFGVSKDLWEEFNFEEGLKDVDEADRQKNLISQARVASSVAAVTKELGL